MNLDKTQTCPACEGQRLGKWCSYCEEWTGVEPASNKLVAKMKALNQGRGGDHRVLALIERLEAATELIEALRLALVSRCSCGDDDDSHEPVPEYPCDRCSTTDIALALYDKHAAKGRRHDRPHH
ncbi:hypothetical protein LCGC14_1533630 [marine sediment metagenome]|uniref:Uncharacterized protein n=1 Tax=marine sediment metagenome TaxID=412755 RepID=A0A0F9IV92_9ZZZZ